MAKTSGKKQKQQVYDDSLYLFHMKHAPEAGTSSGIFAMLPIMIFSAVVIMIVRVRNFQRPMSQFLWTGQTDESWINDFFSYNKMLLILVCAVIALLIILFWITTESLAIKRTRAYIPMAVYSVFVILSYAFSDLKPFAKLGWNDRFEGTLPLLAYMIMLFFVINAVNGEENVKQVIVPIGISSVILNVLGVSQWAGKDFFSTVIGQKLISPNFTLEGGTKLYDAIDAAAANGETYFSFEFGTMVYQTVYNPNYVSFYLNLLLPLFSMLFLRSLLKDSKVKWYKSAMLVVLIGLQAFNAIMCRSMGGIIGLAVSIIMAVIVLNKKLIRWWKPLVVLIAVAAIGLGVTYKAWFPEVQSAIEKGGYRKTVLTREVTADINTLKATAEPASVRPYFDYLNTEADGIEMSLFGNPLDIVMVADENGNLSGINLTDENGSFLPVSQLEGGDGVYSIDDPRFYEYMTLSLRSDSEGSSYLVLNVPGADMYFLVGNDGVYYRNTYGELCTLSKPEAIGFKEKLNYGSGRGYIWSRSIPLLKDSIIIGRGADTFAAAFPQLDYSGKYDEGYALDIIVDKPHNMYLGAAIGTGCISVIALLVLFITYLVQSIKLYFKADFGTDYLYFAGSGIFFGITGFLAGGLFNDSSVSVMPMFYTMLGLGIAINMLLKKKTGTS